MPLLDFFLGLLRTALRLLFLALAALLALGLLGMGLLALSVWVLLNLLRGRRPRLAMQGQFHHWRAFGRRWGPGAKAADSFWPRRGAADTEPAREPTPPLAGRIAPPGPVVDVEFREPSDRRGA